MLKQALKIGGGLFALYLIYAGFTAYRILNEAEVFKEPVFETVAPTLPQDFDGPAILVFSKTNGFRHHGAIAAANQLFEDFAEKQGWQVFVTENGAIHSPALLAKFKVIIWNNNTGDVLTKDQQEAMKNYINGGGHWLGIHGAGGSRSYGWQWYPQQLLKTQFIGHPMFPQFQTGTINVENQRHPATRHLPARWQRVEEWYSFESSPRPRGVEVLATLDESTYNPKLDLLMGGDHPLIWTHEIGKGTAFYSALGHEASAYEEPEYRQLLENTLIWLMTK